MVFSSITFLVYFLPVFLLGYQFVDKKYRNVFVLAASVVFYSWGAPQFVLLLGAATVADFLLVRKIHRAGRAREKKVWLVISLTMNISLLLFFKYANFFVDNINAGLEAMGIGAFEWTRIALPVGISFYTFQSLTYAVDVYRKVHAPLNSLSDYLLYILAFPQMIAGPIVRFNTIADQITGRTETYDERLRGFARLATGLAKKVLISNVMAIQAERFMTMPTGELTPFMAWAGILAYTFHIYFDFSGYSDMAIGLGKMIGFRFPENFNNPYTSASVTEFWRRWHISLGQWMKDYLYVPLGGNRVNSKTRMYLNLGFVFLVSGLWHGASWNFVIWGAYHGVFLILDRIFLLNVLNRIGKLPSVLFTFFVIVVGWVFFKIESLPHAADYIQKMFTPDVSGAWPELPASFIVMFVIAVLFSFVTLFRPGKYAEQIFFSEDSVSLKWHLPMTAISLALFILSLSSITAGGFNPFIYYRF